MKSSKRLVSGGFKPHKTGTSGKYCGDHLRAVAFKADRRRFMIAAHRFSSIFTFATLSYHLGSTVLPHIT